MELTDKLKQLMSGRSEAIERAVDAALGQVGRYGDTLQRQAEVVKDKVRSLDETRTGAPEAAAPTTGTPAPAPATPPPAAAPTPTPTPAPPAPPATGGSALRGDLVDDPTEPPLP